jgi:hypothetical protein
MGQGSSAWAAVRPEILGSVAVGDEGGAYSKAVSFTSEAAAREGEPKEPPPKLKVQLDELAALSVGEPGSSTSGSLGYTPHAEVDSSGLGS